MPNLELNHRSQGIGKMMLPQSWDLFDTLIGRRCGTAGHLFMQMARKIEDSDFPQKRRVAERWFQEKRIPYDLSDIYSKYDELHGGNQGQMLAAIEWQLEQENVFPIQRNARHLQKDDVIVSDMYLSDRELRTLMNVAGIDFDGPIHVSCYGKYSGKAWEPLRGKIRSHCGDNQWIDLSQPQQYGIRTRPARTEFSKLEESYKLHAEDMAYWIRRHRLENVVDEAGKDRLHFLEIEYNAPFLFLCCLALRDFMKKEQVHLANFISRDTFMFEEMFKALFGDDLNFQSKYIFASRECLRSGSESWYAYLNRHVIPDSVIVDLASSAGSLKKALPHLQVTNPRLWTPVFLPSFNVDYEPIRLTYITTNLETRINNTHMEMLNYAPHWHVSGIDEHGMPQFDQVGEYDMQIVMEYNQLFRKMLADLPDEETFGSKELIRKILPLIDAEGRFLRQVFPNHMVFEMKRKPLLS